MSAREAMDRYETAMEKLRAAFVAYLSWQESALADGESGGDVETFIDWVRDEQPDLEALQKQTSDVARSLDNAYRDRRKER